MKESSGALALITVIIAALIVIGITIRNVKKGLNEKPQNTTFTSDDPLEQQNTLKSAQEEQNRALREAKQQELENQRNLREVERQLRDNQRQLRSN